MEIESYFPSTVNGTEEFKTIAKAENPLITDLWEDLSIILEEMFIMTMGIEGIERFEKMLDIKPESEDLEERRKTIIAVLMGEIPYTLPFLVEKAKEYFGDDTTVTVEYEKYLVSIRAYDRFEEQQRAFKVFLRRILPANMVYHLIEGFKVPNILSIRSNLGGSAFVKMPLGIEYYPSATDISLFTLSSDGTTIRGYKGNDINVVIPKGIKAIGNNAFYGCKNLVSITIPNSVTSIGSFAFQGCTNLVSIIIPNSVISIGQNVFPYCESLVSIKIPNSVTSIGHSTFYGCKSLASIIIPNSVTSIGNNTFQGCTNLVSITIPNSVTSIGYKAFQGCTNLKEIFVNKPEGSILDAPWGATNTIVTWTGAAEEEI